jgi:Rrf2 family iron-sulfur cluster assembly transcriptional regulator
MSTKGRFAVNSMIDLALREHQGPIALAAIGQRQQISLSYLEQLFSRLRRAGLVESTRGPGGGYTLGRSVDEITVADIVAAVDDEGEHAAAPAGAAMTRELWAGLDEVMRRHMAAVTLRSLMDDQRARGVVVEDDAQRPAPARPGASASPARRETTGFGLGGPMRRSYAK